MQSEGGRGATSSSWDLNVFVFAIKSVAPSLDWFKVLTLLDSPRFSVVSKDGLQLIMSVYLMVRDGPFPVQVFLGRWTNTSAQLAVVKLLISSDVDVHKCFEGTSRRTEASDVASHPLWSSVDLIETLLQLSDAEGEHQVMPLLTGPRNTCPELLLYGLAQCKPTWGPMYANLISTLCEPYLASSTRNSVLKHVWAINRSVVIQGMVGLAADKTQGRKGLARCFEVAQELGVLLEILSLKHTWKFIIDLAIFASQQNAIPFANWAAKNAEEGNSEFAQTAVGMLRQRAYGSASDGEGAIAGDVASALLQALQAGTFDAVASADIDLLVQETQASSAGGGTAAFPQAAGVAGISGQSAMPGIQGVGEMVGGAGGQMQPGGDMQQGQQNALFAQDIEEEANVHFQRIYTAEIQIEAVVQMLKNFKASADQREQEVFACMIHNLFDEYRFFPRYPERELLITGKLFGSLIQHQLVSSITLGIALRYVLEALRKPLRSNMFKFGMCALEQFKQRLVEWPQYCHHILQITHLRQSHAELMDDIQNALKGLPMAPEGAAPPAVPQVAPKMPTPVGGTQFPLQGPQAGGLPPSAMQSMITSMQSTQLDQQLLRSQNPSKPLGDFNLTIGPAAPAAPPLQQAGQLVPSTAQAQALPSAYAGFDAQQPAGNSLAGFSQGFGQDAKQQLPSNLQHLASDPRPPAGALGAAGAEALILKSTL